MYTSSNCTGGRMTQSFANCLTNVREKYHYSTFRPCIPVLCCIHIHNFTLKLERTPWDIAYFAAIMVGMNNDQFLPVKRGNFDLHSSLFSFSFLSVSLFVTIKLESRGTNAAIKKHRLAALLQAIRSLCDLISGLPKLSSGLYRRQGGRGARARKRPGFYCRPWAQIKIGTTLTSAWGTGWNQWKSARSLRHCAGIEVYM